MTTPHLPARVEAALANLHSERRSRNGILVYEVYGIPALRLAVAEEIEAAVRDALHEWTASRYAVINDETIDEIVTRVLSSRGVSREGRE